MRRTLQAISVCVLAAIAPPAFAQSDGFVGPIAPPANDRTPGTVDAEPAGSAPDGSSAPASSSNPEIVLPAFAIESRPLGIPDGAVAGADRGTVRTGRVRVVEAAEEEPAAGASPIEVGPGWWRTAGALVLVVAVILFVAAVARKLAGRSGGLMHSFGAGGRSPAGLLQVLGRYPVGRGQTLVLLKLDRRILLVCQSVGAKGGGMRTLCEVTDPDEVASLLLHAADAEGRSLSARFRDMVSGFDNDHADAAVTMQPAVTHAEVARPSRGTEIQRPRSTDPVNQLASRLDGIRQRGVEVSA
ncbi:MAG: flagellar biosynthetic protein FliO [Planctomycetota bacterium]|nr:flagellar biosynthetic protein FliO [Planctomycetota bacterium]